jgi:hypothetical protein
VVLISVRGCRNCRDTVKQAAWSVAASAVLSCIRRLLRREVERGELFEQALLLGGAVSAEPVNGGSNATDAQHGTTGTSSTAAAIVSAVDAMSGGFSDAALLPPFCLSILRHKPKRSKQNSCTQVKPKE